MKNLDDLSNIEGLDESITENYTNYCGDEDYSNANWFQDAVKSIKDAGRDAGKNIRNTTKDIGKNIKTTTKEIGQNIERTTKEIGQNIKSTAKDIGKNIGNTLGGGVAVHAVNKFNPTFIIMRGAVLSILNSNLVGISDAMDNVRGSKKHWDEILQKWWMWGGEKSKFNEAVSKGKGKKPLFKDLIEKFQKKKGFDGEYSYADGEYSYADGQQAAKAVLIASSLLGVATGVLTAIPEPATKAAAVWTGAGGSAFGAMGGILKSFAKEQGVPPEQLNQIPETADIPNAAPPTDAKELERINKEIEDSELELERTSGKILGIPKTPFWIGVSVLGIVAGIVIYKKFIKK
jgi:hypothetical protein